MINMDELFLRWHQATVRNNLQAWRALSYWLAAESLMAEVDSQPEEAADMGLLSDLAMQYVADLSGNHMEAAA
jgi:hypothetical protein